MPHFSFTEIHSGSSLRRTLLAAVLASLCALPSVSATESVFNVRDFGATGDGHTIDSPAIQRAINAASAAGGGSVVLPPGTYLSGSIELANNLTIVLEGGSVIEAVDDKVMRYNLPEPNEWGDKYQFQDYGHSHWKNSLLWGIGLHNLSIIGPGLIHGKGLNNGLNLASGVYKDGPPGAGNKAIALRDCNNVLLRDFSILHGGHFGILATGVNNLTIDHLKIDTNRDGMDIDCCINVRISGCSVNSPWDDGICLKASYALGSVRACDNVTISDCYLSGNFEEGTLLDGTFKRSGPEYRSYRTGRIKLGTESNGDFKNIAIANCVFDDCGGLAIESVDGSHIEDVAISNITMRHVANAPIFIRLGARLRGPSGTVVGSIRRVSIDNVVASDANWELGSVITGIPGHPLEDIRISNVSFMQQGGGEKRLFDRQPPEAENKYPEPGMFGAMPSYAFFVRHVNGLEMNHVKVTFDRPDWRSAIVLQDVQSAYFDHIDLRRGEESAPLFILRGVRDFSASAVKGIDDARRPGLTEFGKF